jgi:hypothetical protein
MAVKCRQTIASTNPPTANMPVPNKRRPRGAIEGEDAEQDGDSDRRGDIAEIPDRHAIHCERSHTAIVQSDDAERENRPRNVWRGLVPANPHGKRDGAGDNADQQRHTGKVRIVLDADAREETQHGDEVHAPCRGACRGPAEKYPECLRTGEIGAGAHEQGHRDPRANDAGHSRQRDERQVVLVGDAGRDLHARALADERDCEASRC